MKLFRSPEVILKRLRRSMINASYWFLNLMYMELLMHTLFFEGFSIAYLFTVAFTAVAALIISSLLCLLPRKANAIISLILVSVISFVFCTQLV